MWLFNPYAAALLLPAAHLWLLAAAPGSRLRGPWAALPVALGVALPLLALAHYVSALDLNPLSFAWLLALATADGHISVGTALAVSLWLACLAGLLVVLRVRRKVEAEAEPERLRTRGPAGYAGPGLARRHGVGAAAMRRGCALSTVLIVAGALLLADAAATLLWQEPLSALYGRIQQGKLEDRLSAIEKAPLAAVDQRALSRLDASRRLAFAARSLARRSDDGDPLGRIRMPSIGVSEVFVRGHGHERPAHAGPATTRPRRCPGSAARSRSPATAPPTARRSTTSTTSTAATGSSWRCPTGASPTGSSARGSCRRRRPR